MATPEIGKIWRIKSGEEWLEMWWPVWGLKMSVGNIGGQEGGCMLRV